jgi:hypothetical protein
MAEITIQTAQAASALEAYFCARVTRNSIFSFRLQGDIQELLVSVSGASIRVSDTCIRWLAAESPRLVFPAFLS